MRYRALRTLFAALILSSAFLFAQPSSSQQEIYQSQDKATASTRLVVVDVVVTDSKGQAVKGLKVEDFTVLENGIPQKISNFSFQESGQPRPAAAPQLAPNVISNGASISFWRSGCYFV